jgi:hypothetical protein
VISPQIGTRALQEAVGLQKIMSVETFSSLIMLIIEAAGFTRLEEALESAPEEQPVGGKKRGAGICGVLSRKPKQFSPFQRSLPLAGYCQKEAGRD